MKEILENIANQLGLQFHYGDGSYVNLFDFDLSDLKKKFVLDPIRTSDKLSDVGIRITTTYSGTFMILTKSDIANDLYDKDSAGTADNSKYEKYLKTNMNVAREVQKMMLCYDNFVVRTWNTTEVVNLNDMNADGIVVSFTIDEL
jgi:hypothetical protein